MYSSNPYYPVGQENIDDIKEERELLSNCCGAQYLGELSDDNVGRCADCKDMAEFTNEE